MSENGEIYTPGKNFTLPPALTAWTNSTSGWLPTQLFYTWTFICVNIQILKTQQGNLLRMIKYNQSHVLIFLTNPGFLDLPIMKSNCKHHYYSNNTPWALGKYFWNPPSPKVLIFDYMHLSSNRQAMFSRVVSTSQQTLTHKLLVHKTFPNSIFNIVKLNSAPGSPPALVLLAQGPPSLDLDWGPLLPLSNTAPSLPMHLSANVLR